MDLNTFSGLDCRPFLSELLHHFFPDEQRFIGKLVDPLLGLLLELEKTEASLNGCSLGHEEFEVGVGDAGFVSPPVFLDDCGG